MSRYRLFYLVWALIGWMTYSSSTPSVEPEDVTFSIFGAAVIAGATWPIRLSIQNGLFTFAKSVMLGLFVGRLGHSVYEWSWGARFGVVWFEIVATFVVAIGFIAIQHYPFAAVPKTPE